MVLMSPSWVITSSNPALLWGGFKSTLINLGDEALLPSLSPVCVLQPCWTREDPNGLGTLRCQLLSERCSGCDTSLREGTSSLEAWPWMFSLKARVLFSTCLLAL